jgi:hypothetical protein
MKTTKKRLQKLKSKQSKKDRRKMIGGSLDSIVMSNTIKLLKDTVNYLQINGTKVYYTQVRFDLTPRIIDGLISYGLNPGLGGSVVDTSQPYIIYFFIYYYTSKIFTEFFKMKDRSDNSNLDLFLLPDSSDLTDVLSKKDINSSLDIIVERTYCIFANLSNISSVITLGLTFTQLVIRFSVKSGKKVDVNKNNTFSEFVITGIYMLGDVPDNVTPVDFQKDIISKITNEGSVNLSKLYTPVPYSDDVRYKIKSIVLYSIDIEKQLISLQTSNTRIQFLLLNGGTHLNFNKILYVTVEIPYHISATFLSFINKITDTLKGNITSSISANEANKLLAITENYIPNVLNIYLSTPSYSPITLNNVLLKRSMLPPYNTSSSDELQINPRYNFTRMKSRFTTQYCKSNKECYIDTLYSVSEFTKFNKQNKSGKRLQTIQQVTPNVVGNIETTLSLLLPNNRLKINDQEFLVTDYNWDQKWKLMGPKDTLLSLQPQVLHNTQVDKVVDTQTCYKNILEFYDDLFELFYPSMAGKDITKIYGNYLRILNERNILLKDVKRLVNQKTYSIKTQGLSDEDTVKIASIQTKSITLNEYINKFVDAILYQLIIIGNITRKIINRIHSSCFFYFGFDRDLYIYDTSSHVGTTPERPPNLMEVVPNIQTLISDDAKYNTGKYIEQLSSMYYPSTSDNYTTFFDYIICNNLLIDEYKNIIQSFSDVIKTVFERLNKIAGRMIEIKNDNSRDMLNLSNETLGKLWISDETIENSFSNFEKKIRTFIKYNLTDNYYSRTNIERLIDDIMWDMDKSNSYTYCRLFTTFVFDNIWDQFEMLFSLKVLQYIFLIYQYTGKYIYYTNIIQRNKISDQFMKYLEGYPDLNLFSCVVNWFKFNCMFQIQNLIEMNGDVATIRLRDIQYLFATNELIIGSYALMKYYITQIIMANLDVCQLTTELQTFVDILSPNNDDLKSIMPQLVNENENKQNTNDTNKNSPETDNKNNSNEPNTKIMSYNVQVQVKVKQIAGDKEPVDKLTSNNIYEYLGCKNRDLQFQLNKLKQSTGILTGDITGYISKQAATLTGPDISQLTTNLKKTTSLTFNTAKEDVTKLFINPEFIQILGSIDLPERSGNIENTKEGNFFISVNSLVYNLNVRTNQNQTNAAKLKQSDIVFHTIDKQVVNFDDIKRLFDMFHNSPAVEV